MSSPASEHCGHNSPRFGATGRAAAASARANNNNRSQEEEEEKEADEYDGLFDGEVGDVPFVAEVGDVPFGAGDAAGRPEDPPPEENVPIKGGNELLTR